MLQLAIFPDACSPPEGDTRLSQWCTPTALASRLVRWAGIRKGQRCLEPSCGTGSFVQALLEHGAEVVANDIDPRMTAYVEAAHGPNRGLRAVWNADFLEGDFSDSGFDWIVMNPPYEDGQDREHLTHALHASPRILALTRSSLLQGVDARHKIWKSSRVRKVGLIVRRPRFLLGGVASKDSGRHDYCAVVLDQYYRRYEPTLEWLI